MENSEYYCPKGCGAKVVPAPPNELHYCKGCGLVVPNDKVGLLKQVESDYDSQRARAVVEGVGGLEAVEQDEEAYQAAIAAMGDD